MKKNICIYIHICIYLYIHIIYLDIHIYLSISWAPAPPGFVRKTLPPGPVPSQGPDRFVALIFRFVFQSFEPGFGFHFGTTSASFYIVWASLFPSLDFARMFIDLVMDIVFDVFVNTFPIHALKLLNLQNLHVCTFQKTMILIIFILFFDTGFSNDLL